MSRTSVGIAELAVGGAGDVLATVGLGSCVAVVLLDPVVRVGGLAHVLLPEARLSRDASKAAKFMDLAVPELIGRVEEAGARRARLEAYLVGGAAMFGALMTGAALNMGLRNVEAARAELERAGVRVAGEEVGGEQGRSVHLTPGRGEVVVTSALRPNIVLRAGDPVQP